jgi:hypothetical protein
MRLRELIVAIKVRADIAGAREVDKIVDKIAKSAKVTEGALVKTERAAAKSAKTIEAAAKKQERADQHRAREAERAAAKIERAQEREAKAHERKMAAIQRATERSIAAIRALSKANQDQFDRLGDIRGRQRDELKSEFFGPRTTVREGLAGAAGTLARGAGAFVGGLAVAGGFALGKAGDMESLRARLKVQEGGDAVAAEETLNRIKGLAKDLPGSVEEVTSTLVRLRSQGLDATNEALTKHSDIASSAGKTILEWAEAVLDATTGERERLKGFGVTSKDLGDQVSFTFKGQTTVVEDNAKAIEEYLLSLGDLPGIAGASAAQMTTLKGVISNFGDAFTNAIDDAMRSTGALEEAKGLIGDLAGNAGGLAAAFGEVLVDGLKTAREWISSLTAEDIQAWIDGAVEAGKAMIDMISSVVTGVIGFVEQARSLAETLDLSTETITTMTLAFGALAMAGGGLPGVFAAVGVAAARMGSDIGNSLGGLNVELQILEARINQLKADKADLDAKEADLRGDMANQAAFFEDRNRLMAKGAFTTEVSDARQAEAAFEAMAAANRTGFGEELFATAEQQAGDRSEIAGVTAEQVALARAGSAVGLGAQAGRAKTRLDAAKRAELERIRKAGGDAAAREAGLAANELKARKAFTDAIRKGLSEDDAIAAAEHALLSTKAKKGKKGAKAKGDKQVDLLTALGVKGPGSILDGRPTPQSLTIETTVVVSAAKDINVHVTLPEGATLGRSADQVGHEIGQAVEPAVREMMVSIAEDTWSLQWGKLAKARGGGRVPKHMRRAGA